MDVEPIKPEETEEKQPQNPILIIEMMPDGGVVVNGPIRLKGLVYGMLEQAKDAIHEYHLEQKYKLSKTVDIVKSNGHGMMDFVRRFKV